MVKPKEIVETAPQEVVNNEADLLNQLENADHDNVDILADLDEEFNKMDGGKSKQNPFGQSVTKELLA